MKTRASSGPIDVIGAIGASWTTLTGRLCRSGSTLSRAMPSPAVPRRECGNNDFTYVLSGAACWKFLEHLIRKVPDERLVRYPK